MKRLATILAALVLLTACATPTAPPQNAEKPPSSEDTSVPSVPEPDPFSPVYTDWSKLTPYTPIESLYTYFDPYSGDEALLPSDDYGTLLSYIGTDSSLDRYIIDKMPLYGLVTDKGQLVTEPVYADIIFTGSFLVLTRGELYGYIETEWGWAMDGGFSYTVAAPDGKWVRTLGNVYDFFLLDEEHLVTTLCDGSVLVLCSDGTTMTEFSSALLEPYLGTNYTWSWDMGPSLSHLNGLLTVFRYDEAVTDGDYIVCYLDPFTGDIFAEPPEGWDDTYHYEEQTTPEVPGYNYLEKVTDEVTGTVYYFGVRPVGDDFSYDLLREDGQIIYEDCVMEDFYLWAPMVRAGLIATVKDGAFCYHSMQDDSMVFRFPLRSNSD